MAPECFPALGTRLAAPKTSRAWAHSSPWHWGPGGHGAPAGSQVLVGQKGVQDHLPGCPRSPDKTSVSCQLLLESASAVPQFPLSYHHRLVPCILAAPAPGSSGAAPQGGLGRAVTREVHPLPFARGVSPGRQSRCRNAGLGGSSSWGQAVPAAGARRAVRPLGSGSG